MKIIRFSYQGSVGYGILKNDHLEVIDKPAGDWLVDRLRPTGQQIKASAIRLLAPCEPTKVLCIGLNYSSHAKELNLPLPEKPVLFMKPNTAVIGSGEQIVCPPQSRRVDFEAELGVVIGRKARQVNQKNALDYVLGYTCANDVTARDLQPADGQWIYAKGFDTFCPLGPAIETSIENPEGLRVNGYLNGELKQSASTADHVFTVPELIAYISSCMTLLPGDVIITGTPSGIGPMKPGDEYMVEIAEIGRLVNPCV